MAIDYQIKGPIQNINGDLSFTVDSHDKSWLVIVSQEALTDADAHHGLASEAVLLDIFERNRAKIINLALKFTEGSNAVDPAQTIIITTQLLNM